MADAVVIGAGPNGLVAANMLADAGWDGRRARGGARAGRRRARGELTLPGFVHDRFSAFYPLAVASPRSARLRLEAHGLRWRRAPLVLAHPRADGPLRVAVADLDETAASLDAFAPGDGDAWRALYALLGARRRRRSSSAARHAVPAGPRGRAAGARRLGPRGLRLRALRRCCRCGAWREEEFRGAGGARAARRQRAARRPHARVGRAAAVRLGPVRARPAARVARCPRAGPGGSTDALVRGSAPRRPRRVRRARRRGARPRAAAPSACGSPTAARSRRAARCSPTWARRSCYLELLGREHVPRARARRPAALPVRQRDGQGRLGARRRRSPGPRRTRAGPERCTSPRGWTS